MYSFISESPVSSYGSSGSNSSASDSSPFNPDDSNDQLADKITLLAGQINAANYRFLKMIAEFDRRIAWEGPGIRSCAYWLNWKCGIDMGAAREKVRVARSLAGLPKIDAAFEKGELSYSKVRSLSRVATEQNEAYLLNIAQHGTTSHVDKLVGAFRTVSRSGEGLAAEPDELTLLSALEEDRKREQVLFESRGVSYYQDDEGMWVIKAKLPAEAGGLVVKLLRELGDQLANADKQEDAASKNVSAETFSSYKKEDLDDAGLLQDKLLKEEPLLEKESLTFPQRRADALLAMAESFSCLAAKDKGLDFKGLDFKGLDFKGLSLKGHERCQLVLHVNAAFSSVTSSVSSSNSSSPQDANLDGRWLLPDAARRLACDASLLVVTEDDVGNVLDIGRRSRIIPAGMARALSIRDGGCQFPGCCESRYVEGHHIKHWADGGETKLDNLVTLCRYHHRELHRGRFYLSVKAASAKPKGGVEHFADRLCFSTVGRKQIVRNPADFSCGCCDELKKALPKDIYDGIDVDTAVTKWAGEQMDLSMAVDGLLGVSRV